MAPLTIGRQRGARTDDKRARRRGKADRIGYVWVRTRRAWMRVKTRDTHGSLRARARPRPDPRRAAPMFY